jgi:Fur family transcriptional regulator, ferric uptake regulator
MVIILVTAILRALMKAGQLDPRAVLAERGIRPTEQRLAVLDALAKEPNDATAQQIHAELSRRGIGTGLATVYRTLGLLSEHGVVDALIHSPGETCYRLCGDEHHHHLVCSSCHRVVELPDCAVEVWLDRAAAWHGFVATGHRLEATGLCSTCRS